MCIQVRTVKMYSLCKPELPEVEVTLVEGPSKLTFCCCCWGTAVALETADWENLFKVIFSTEKMHIAGLPKQDIFGEWGWVFDSHVTIGISLDIPIWRFFSRWWENNLTTASRYQAVQNVFSLISLEETRGIVVSCLLICSQLLFPPCSLHLSTKLLA